MEHLKGLGQYAKASEHVGRRDAFHKPGVLVTCSTSIRPGARVKFTDSRGIAIRERTVQECEDNDYDAIVDPFIDDFQIAPGHEFWVCLRPGLTSNLTHHFSVQGLEDHKTELSKEETKEGFTFKDLLEDAESPLPDNDDFEDDGWDDGCQGCD
jgi:hypothetical protein